MTTESFASTVPTCAWWLADDGSELISAPVLGWQHCTTYFGRYDPVVLSERGAAYVAADACLLLPTGTAPGPEHHERLLEILLELAEVEVVDSVLLSLLGDYVGRTVHLATLAAATGRTLTFARGELWTLDDEVATARGLLVELGHDDMVTVSPLPAGTRSKAYMAGAATLAATLSEVAS